MAVKMKAEANMPPHAQPCGYSRFWLLYFVFTIAMIGFFDAYLLSVPIYLLGRFFELCMRNTSPQAGKKLTELADRILCAGIRLLMSVQPWLNADIRIDLNTSGNGTLLVSNHRSHLDAFILLSRVRGIRIFAKRSLFYIPFLGMMMRMSRQIPVAREIDAFFQAMNAVRDRLRDGGTVHIFPEMTRCAPGQAGTRNFSALPFLIAIQEKVTVIPIVFRNTDQVWPKDRFGLAFRRPMQAWTLVPVDPAAFSSAEELRSEVRRRIDAALVTGPTSAGTAANQKGNVHDS